MELGLESFSIREYTANMRGVDARMCWPFGPSEGEKDEDEDGERRRALRLLPPMARCRKSHWWSADLRAARSGNTASDAEGEDACAAARIHAAGPRTEDGINAVGDGEGQGKQMSRAASMSKQQQQTKVRTPKKRSIVELFAAAPPIENQTAAVRDAGDDAGDSDEEDGGQRRHPPGEDDAVTGVDKGIAAGQGENHPSVGVDDDSDVPTAAAAPPAVPPRKRKLEFVEILMRTKGNKRRTRMKTATTSSSISAATAQSAAINCNHNRGSKRKKRMQKNSNSKRKVSAPRKEEKKDTMHNVSLPSKVDFSVLLHGSMLRRCGKKIKKHVGKRKKDIKKSLSKKKKSVQTASMSTKKQFRKCASFPIQGILKKHTRVTSSEKNKKNGDIENFSSCHNVSRQSRKHVHFSDSYGMVSIRNEHENTDLRVQFPQAVSINKASSDMPSSFLDESSKESDVARVDMVTVIGIADISQVSSPSRDNLADVHVSAIAPSPIDLNLQSTETIKFSQSLDLNDTLHDCHSLDLSSPSLCAAPNDLQSGKSSASPKEKPNENLFWSAISATDGSGVPLSHIPDRNTMSTSPFTGSILQSSVSSSVRQVNCYQSCVTDRLVNNAFNQYSESQAFSAQHQKDLRDKNHLPENVSRINPASNCQEKYDTRDVIGLPLNSQGEFITWDSCYNVISNKLSQNHNEGSCSNKGFQIWDAIGPRYDSECLKMKDKFLGYAGVSTKSTQLPYKTFLGKNQYSVSEFPVECCKDHCQGLTQGNDGHMRYLEMNHLETNIYSRGKRELYTPHACNRMRLIQTGSRSQAGSVIQPTMRLMGKDVTVGSENHQGLDSCKAWRDSLSLTENHPATSLSNPSTSNWCSQERSFNYQSSEASRQLYLSCMQNKKSNLHQMISGGPRTDPADIDREPCVICRNAMSLGSGFEGPNLDFAMPNFNQVAVNTSSKWTDSPSTLMSQKPFAQAQLCKSFQSIPPNPAIHNLGQLLSFGGTSCPPSLQNQYTEKHIQPMVAQAPVQNLPHWLRVATKNKNIHSSCYDLISKHCPCTVSDSDPGPIITPVCHSIISFPVNDCASNDAVIHSLSIPSSQGTPFMASKPAMSSNSVMNNNKLKGKQKSSGSLTPGYHLLVSTAQNYKSRRGFYEQSDGFQRPARKPSYTGEHWSGIQEGIRSMHHSCPREVFHGSTEMRAEEGRMDLNGSEAVNLRSNRKSRAGPVRLSAGAKHILRPCQNNEQDRFRPVHSTIPFAGGTSSKNILESHANAAKIYQF